jgi:hypothetical protein
VEQPALETRHVLLAKLHRPTIVPQAAVGVPQIVLRRDREANLPQGRGNHQGALTGGEGVVRSAGKHKMGEQIGSDPSQAMLVAQDFGEGVGFL